MSKPFRVVTDHDSEPIPHSQAQLAFQSAWKRAREAYIDMLASIPGHYPKRLLNGTDKTLTASQVRAARSEAAETVRLANLMLAALDEAVNVVSRAVPDATQEPR